MVSPIGEMTKITILLSEHTNSFDHRQNGVRGEVPEHVGAKHTFIVCGRISMKGMDLAERKAKPAARSTMRSTTSLNSSPSGASRNFLLSGGGRAQDTLRAQALATLSSSAFEARRRPYLPLSPLWTDNLRTPSARNKAFNFERSTESVNEYFAGFANC